MIRSNANKGSIRIKGKELEVNYILQEPFSYVLKESADGDRWFLTIYKNGAGASWAYWEEMYEISKTDYDAFKDNPSYSFAMEIIKNYDPLTS